MSVDENSGGYVWRKYGEKTVGIRKRAVKRSYFRCVCSHAHSPCSAKKRVDRLVSAEPEDDPLSISYINDHNHGPKRDGSGMDGQVELQEVQSMGSREWSQMGGSDVGSRLGLEQMRAQDLAAEMHSDLMLQYVEMNASRGIHASRRMCDGSEMIDLAGCVNSTATKRMKEDPSTSVPLEEAESEFAEEAEDLLKALFESSKRPSGVFNQSPAEPNNYGVRAIHLDDLDAAETEDMKKCAVAMEQVLFPAAVHIDELNLTHLESTSTDPILLPGTGPMMGSFAGVGRLKSSSVGSSCTPGDRSGHGSPFNQLQFANQVSTNYPSACSPCSIRH